MNRGYKNNQAPLVLNKLDLEDNSLLVSGDNLPIGMREANDDIGSCNFGTDRPLQVGRCIVGNNSAFVITPVHTSNLYDLDSFEVKGKILFPSAATSNTYTSIYTHRSIAGEYFQLSYRPYSNSFRCSVSDDVGVILDTPINVTEKDVWLDFSLKLLVTATDATVVFYLENATEQQNTTTRGSSITATKRTILAITIDDGVSYFSIGRVSLFGVEVLENNARTDFFKCDSLSENTLYNSIAGSNDGNIQNYYSGFWGTQDIYSWQDEVGYTWGGIYDGVNTTNINLGSGYLNFHTTKVIRIKTAFLYDTDTGNNTQPIIGNTDLQTSEVGRWLLSANDGTNLVTFFYQSASGGERIQADIELGKWYNVEILLDRENGILDMTVNNQTIPQVIVPLDYTTDYDITRTCYMGRIDNTAYSFNGIISDMEVWFDDTKKVDITSKNNFDTTGFTNNNVNFDMIPRDESQPTLDVFGNPLQYKGAAPSRAEFKESPCWLGDGISSYSITGLLTTDTITSFGSSDVPTCTTDGTLNLASGGKAYGVLIQRSGVDWAYITFSEEIENAASHTSFNVLTPNSTRDATLVDGSLSNQSSQDEFHYSQLGFYHNGTQQVPILSDMTAYADGTSLSNGVQQDGNSFLDTGTKLAVVKTPRIVDAEEVNRFYTDANNDVVNKSHSDFTGVILDQDFSDISEPDTVKNIRKHKQELEGIQLITDTILTNNN